MKAIVLEIRGGVAAVLREDGSIVKTRQKCAVGERIELDAKLVVFPQKRRLVRALVAAALAIVVLGGSFTYMAVPASAYVSIDVGESSVELGFNRLGRVVEVKALNEGSASLARELADDVRFRPADEAMERTARHLRERGWLDGEDDVVVAGVVAEDDSRREELCGAVDRHFPPEGGLELHRVDVTPRERGEAMERGESGGRFVYDRMPRPDRKPDGQPGGDRPPKPPQKPA